MLVCASPISTCNSPPAPRNRLYDRCDWSKPQCNESYRNLMDKALDDIPCLTPSSDRDQLLHLVENQLDQISEVMHATAAQSNCCQKSQCKPKPYWCPELSKLRDRKTFWWHLWEQNDRPRHGILYDCYKGVKKLFRQVSRRAVDTETQKKFYQLNSLYKCRNMRGLWNSLRHRKFKNIPSKLAADDFANHFRPIMQDSSDLNTEQTEIRGIVSGKYRDVADYGG